ncbi:uncharacterized protein RAG0_15602 [Rhynchosporium agropyri]|uniref:Uncharacterized protein n=1 Tax=Rhynchosporium agropyri TaxID=914238 RepID=A0A1E1LLS4_9HELO|nr:uncharacterized protein RAG0_15602 [Rhynchosporium agropyri]
MYQDSLLAAKHVAKLVQDKLHAIVRSPTKGAGFTILRNRIGSGPKKGDSILPVSPGSPEQIPNYVWDGIDNRQVWVSQQAKAYGVTRFYANALSAPGFMKTNGVDTDRGYLCGVGEHTCASGDWKAAYAHLLIQYVKFYKAEGIDYSYLGFVNEPDYTTAYSSVLASGNHAAEFIKVLHPALVAAGLESVGITCCDMIARITGHGYSSDATIPLKTSRPTWLTEKETTDAWNGHWYSTGSVSDGYTWANHIYNAIVKGGVSAYFYWEGIEKTTVNAGLIKIEGMTLFPSARLWAYAHFSRAARPDAVRVATSGAPLGVNTVAFQNTDGTVSVIMINTNSVTTTVQVGTAGFNAQSVTGFVTSQANITMGVLDASVNGGLVGATIPEHGIVSLILSGKPGNNKEPIAPTTSKSTPTLKPTTSSTPIPTPKHTTTSCKPTPTFKTTTSAKPTTSVKPTPTPKHTTTCKPAPIPTHTTLAKVPKPHKTKPIARLR